MKISDFVSKYDPQNQFEVLVNTYTQIDYAWNNKSDLSSLKNRSFQNVIVSGLGGSAISGDLIGNFLGNELKIPFFVNRNYLLPAFAKENSLVIVSSYSGNTEETISVFKEALNKKTGIVAITTGGEIERIALANSVPVIKLKEGYQPRYSLGLSFFSLLKVFRELGFCSVKDSLVNEISDLWKQKGIQYSKENNSAAKIAEELIGFIPVIYSVADVTSSVGYRFKCQLNENSKIHAFHNVFPELNHNEIIGWETFNPSMFSSKIIFISDENYHPQIKKRFSITGEIISRKGCEIIRLESREKTLQVRLMDLIYFTDWITYYAAIFRGQDPSEIDFIHELKNRLSA
ncbi:MAG: bifunctional phosphoglucose/phosphomannose isomerase [Ignavibacteriaceae bacterium]